MALSISTWILIFVIILFIVAICFAIGWTSRNNSAAPPPAPGTFNPPQVWGGLTRGPTPIKNQCSIYQFEGSAITGVTGITGFSYSPGAPTYDAQVLNNKTGEIGYPSDGCFDFDQIYAQQVQRTCTQPANTTGLAPSFCYEIDGTVVQQGTTEIFYSNTLCAAVPACHGELALISVNYQIPEPPAFADIPAGNMCLSVKDQQRGTIEVLPCNPLDDNQIFRITRTNIGQDPSTLKANQGQNGIITQILQRKTQRCLVPSDPKDKAGVIYYPQRTGYTGCTGPSDGDYYQTVKLDVCEGGIAPGYVWATMPSFNYCDEPIGCPGCTGCTIGCTGILHSPVCTGAYGCNTGCVGFSTRPTAPQLVYVGNTLNEAPFRDNTYAGLTGPNALFEWMIQNNMKSLYSGGSTGVGLAPIADDIRDCRDKTYSIQYLTLATYNTASSEPVCTALVRSNCLPL